MKKVLLIVIDACTSRILMPAIEDGRLPNIAALARAGALDPNCVTIFPSITPAATASIVTGCYPQEHGIAGAFWYDADEERVLFFGDDVWVVMSEGVGKFFEDFLVKLNHERLRAETLFQTVERAGLRAACLNYFIFHGDTEHKVHVPFLLSLLPGVPFSEVVHGPSMLCLGDFIENRDAAGEKVEARGGIFNTYGLKDEGTAQFLIKLARDRALPDFTLAYFPDYDLHSHKVGPVKGIEALIELDEKFGKIYEAFGGLEAMLEEVCVVLTADHSQSMIGEDKEKAGIHLDEVLAGFALADAGEPWDGDDQLMVCPNMRAAQIYFHRPDVEQLERVVHQLLTDPRVDQVMWRDALVAKGGRGYRVVTHDRGILHFWTGADGRMSAVDRQQQRWSWEGDLSTLDARVTPDGVLEFGDYPNAFERIACGLDNEEGGDLWVTATPDHEFCVPRTEVHTGGGSHGSLHILDSLVPLLLAGAPDGITLPDNPRAVDVAPLCLSILGLAPVHPVGASHVKNTGATE